MFPPSEVPPRAPMRRWVLVSVAAVLLVGLGVTASAHYEAARGRERAFEAIANLQVFAVLEQQHYRRYSGFLSGGPVPAQLDGTRVTGDYAPFRSLSFDPGPSWFQYEAQSVRTRDGGPGVILYARGDTNGNGLWVEYRVELARDTIGELQVRNEGE